MSLKQKCRSSKEQEVKCYFICWLQHCLVIRSKLRKIFSFFVFPAAQKQSIFQILILLKHEGANFTDQIFSGCPLWSRMTSVLWVMRWFRRQLWEQLYLAKVGAWRKGQMGSLWSSSFPSAIRASVLCAQLHELDTQNNIPTSPFDWLRGHGYLMPLSHFGDFLGDMRLGCRHWDVTYIVSSVA